MQKYTYHELIKDKYMFHIEDGKIAIVESSNDALEHFRENNLDNAILCSVPPDLHYEHPVKNRDAMSLFTLIDQMITPSVNQVVYICNKIASDYFVPVHEDLTIRSQYDIINDLTILRFTKK